MNDGAALKLQHRLDLKEWFTAARLSLWQDRSTRRTLLLMGWFGVLWFLLAGGWREGLVGLAFVAVVILPIALMIQQILLSWKISKTLAQSLAGALTLIVLPFLFLLRKLSPIGPVATDLMLCVVFALASFGVASFSGTFRPRLPSISLGEAAWLAVVIPAVFVAPRLGNEVRVGDQIVFYGPSLMDFGNLRVVVNLLTHDSLQVPAPVATCGTLIYHWLYFATPAWLSHFLGGHLESGTALILMNFVTAVLFFRCVALVCGEVVSKAGFDAQRWAPLGACLAISGASLAYFYAFAAKAHLVPMGERNQLMLQIPSSMSTFGNNTLALSLIILALLLVMAWNDGGKSSRLTLAAVLVAFVPALSITLAPTVGAGLALACLAGAVRRRWLALGAFTTAGGVSLAMLSALGYFRGSRSVPAFSFDGGQFVQNVLFAFPLVVMAVAWCSFHQRSSSTRLFASMFAAAVALPTFLFISGDPDVPSHMSMKNATLLVVAGIPLVTLAIAAWWDASSRHSQGWKIATAAFCLLGFANSAGYLVATPLTRLGYKIQPSSSIPADYYEALRHVRSSTPLNALLLDPTGAENQLSNPGNIFAARRAILPSGYDLLWHYTNEEVERRRTAWRQWRDSSFADEKPAAYLAEAAQCLVSPSEVKSMYWQLDARFGSYFVYRSLPSSHSKDTQQG